MRCLLTVGLMKCFSVMKKQHLYVQRIFAHSARDIWTKTTNLWTIRTITFQRGENNVLCSFNKTERSLCGRRRPGVLPVMIKPDNM